MTPRTLSGAFALCLSVCLFLGAPPPAKADPLTPDQEKQVEQIIRDTLAKHPEIVLGIIQRAQDAQKDQADNDSKSAIVAQRSLLLSDPTSPVAGNPKGDVTIVEFFDYRCPYCKEVEPALEALLKEDKNLRIVYKEFPILGPSSVFATRVALAARKEGKYDEFHHAMMAVRGSIDNDVVLHTAMTVGLDPDNLKRDLDDDAIGGIIARNYALARKLDVDGTPAFIVGDEMMPGAASIADLRQAVAKARAGG